MSRLLHIGKQGTITDNPLSSGATSINSAEFADLPVVSGSDTLDITLDPNGIGGDPEIVTITAHTSAATVVTATRASYTALGGGGARSHVAGTKWVHGIMPADLVGDHGGLSGLGDDDHTQYLNESRHEAVDHSGLITAVPTGTVLPFAGSSAPSGYLVAVGTAVSRTTYSGLFAVIGTTYGSGDGSTTFNLPDLGGRVVAGKETSASRLTSGTSGVAGNTLGAAGGDQRYHQHNHTDSGHTHTQAAHSHTFSWTAGNPAGGNVGQDATLSGSPGFTAAGFSTPSLSNATPTINSGNAVIGNSGSGSSQNVQPTIVLNYIIKT